MPVYLNILVALELIMFFVSIITIFLALIASGVLKNAVKDQNPKLFQEIYGLNLWIRIKNLKKNYGFFRSETDEFGKYKKNTHRLFWIIGILFMGMIVDFIAILCVAYISGTWK